jgi:tetratricopeptide (TPR) repeat protein
MASTTVRVVCFSSSSFSSFALAPPLLHESSGDGQKGIEYFNQALNLSRKISYRRGEARTLVNLGRSLESLGQQQKAARHYNDALIIFRAVRDRSGEAQALYESAKLEATLGNLNQARLSIEQAVGIIESLRTKIGSEDLRASYFASAHRFYELYMHILNAATLRAAGRGD